MNIKISIKAKNDAVVQEAMTCINQAADDEPQWERDNYGYYETVCDAAENDILRVFNELIAKYPELNIFASYSQDIREDDSSAQWWRSTTIKTKHHPDGTATLDIDSGTYWF